MSTDTEFSFILSEYLALSNNFGANTGEVLRAASQIVPGDFESWYREFNYLAQQIEAQANTTRSPIASRDAYFRSASYYRAADFFLHHNVTDPRLTTLWNAQLDHFAKAIALLPYPAEKITVQGPNFTIPVYFYPGEGSDGCSKLPTVIAGTGYDASQEELWHSQGREITARGWNFVSYEGPGQPTPRRQQGLGFIPNWWDVTGPVADYLETRDDVDLSKLALLGQSFGAILTVRAAAVDPRYAAVMVVDGLYSMQEVLREQFFPQLITYFDAGNATAFNAYTTAIYNTHVSTTFNWVVDQGLWSFATASYYDWFSQLGDYTIDGYAQNISVPIYVAAGDHDTLAGTQAATAAEMIGAEATYHVFEHVLGAGEHCQLGAESQLALYALDWLADVFDGVNGTAVNGTAV